MEKIKLALYTLILALVLFSCKKTESIYIPSEFDNGYWILNEGTFNFGNASLDFFNPNKDTVYSNIYESINNKKLGDVAQSLLKTEKYLLIAVNNSQKIEVLDLKTMKIVKTITGLGSPRYMEPIDSNRILVTELYNKKLHIVNLETGSIEKSLETFGWSEKMITLNNLIYVQIKKHPSEPKGKSGFIVLNKTNLSIVNIELDYEPISICLARNYLWCLAKMADDHMELKAISLTTFDALDNSIVFDKSSNPQHLVSDGSDLYFYSNKKFKSISLSNLSNPLVVRDWIDLSSIDMVYSIQYDSDKKLFYITDASDYVSKGKVFIYGTQGELRNKISCGVIPNFVLSTTK